VTAPARDRLLFLLALVLGASGALAYSLLGWNGKLFVLPLTMIGLVLLGYFGSRAAWRWPLLVFGAQLAVVLARDGGRNLLGLGAGMFLAFAALGLAPTYLGVALRRAGQRRKAARFAANLRRAELEGPH
jgi:hypothetical protein